MAELQLQAELAADVSAVNSNARQSFRAETATKMLPKLTAEN